MGNVIDELRNGLSMGRGPNVPDIISNQCAHGLSLETQTQILYQEKKNHNLVLLRGGG